MKASKRLEQVKRQPVRDLDGKQHWGLVVQATVGGDEVAAEILAKLRGGEHVVLNGVEYQWLPN